MGLRLADVEGTYKNVYVSRDITPTRVVHVDDNIEWKGHLLIDRPGPAYLKSC